ncbi:beta-glucosidase [Rhizomicrobium palustre]|uniref:Beta-glucosidase n=1 Tax=Rhizomicrobium palustre TaxID=189966 RepID=A0A846MVB3_9PROT|nr:glycoside hydrolase family 3 protein [Rhizomicrobium palustre]NIK87303.1 beta-glucosidase [Rhizomicrobium palustre]
MKAIPVTPAKRNALVLSVCAFALMGCSTDLGIGDIGDLFSSDQPSAQKPVDSAPTPVAPTPAAPAAPASAPAVDLATSTVIHPELWPLTPPPAKNSAIEAEVQRLLSQMTLEEKIGQMMQPDIKAITPADISQYHLGSILNGGSAGPHGDLRAPAQDWLAAADLYYNASVAVAPGRPVIPTMWGIDAVHGHGHIIGATLFPHNIALGAMRDPDLVRRIGEITAQEIRVTGQEWTFAPTVAVVRDDRWGRTYEGYSEDPGLVAKNAAAMVEGLQGKPGTPDYLRNGHVLASVKHFIGDGATDHGINEGNTTYSETALRDIFAPPYAAAIKAGAQNIMISYSGWRGLKMHVQKELVSDVLVGRMGFPGFVISDYQAIDRVAGCTVSDCPQAANAGIDMFMTANDWKGLYNNLLKEVRDGTIPQARIDEAVSRILRVKLQMGLMSAGKPSSRPFAGRYDLLGSHEHRDIARRAVRESLVLLKNDGGLLPLSPRSHVLVAGDGANNMSKQTGGWTITWQGTATSRADFPHASTIYDGIKANVEASGGTAQLSEDGSFRERPDVAIVVFGEDAYAEGKGDIQTLEYSPNDKRDLKLLQKLQAQGIPVVAVFLSGRPLYVTPEINASNAFVAAWQPGSEGEGVSDMLFANADGSVAFDFRGRLSFSWPRSPDQYDLNIGQEPYFPLFAFGYGLTYGAPQNIGRLAEASAVRPLVRAAATTVATAPSTPASAPLGPVLDRRPLFENGDVTSGWTVTAGGQRVAVKSSVQGLTAQRSENGLSANWASHVPVSLTVTGAPIDLTREADRGMSLSFSIDVDKAPTAPVVLAMGCGPLCGGKLDVSALMKDAAGRPAATINVPLACLKSAGADLTNVTTPFALTTSGNFSVRVSQVRISRESEALTCASVPPVTAAAAVPAGSRRDFYVGSAHSGKKKSGETHVRKKRSANSSSADNKTSKKSRRKHH